MQTTTTRTAAPVGPAIEEIFGANGAEIRPLSPALGAEILGVDVAKPIGDDQMRFIRDALHRHSLILLRCQHISPADQVAFARRFGAPLRVSIFSGVKPDGLPELTIVSNKVKDGKPVGVKDAGALWHTDGSYLLKPDLYTALYAVEVPMRDGKALGDTAFLSTAAAYDALPLELKRRIEGRRAVHSLTFHMGERKKKNFHIAAHESKPDVDHPLVRTHPITGRKCIYATQGHTRSIVGMSDEEGDALLQELWAHLMRPEFAFRHTWAVGDLLVWDNCATQHLAITDYGDLPRMLYRAGMEGPVPC